MSGVPEAYAPGVWPEYAKRWTKQQLKGAKAAFEAEAGELRKSMPHLFYRNGAFNPSTFEEYRREEEMHKVWTPEPGTTKSYVWGPGDTHDTVSKRAKQVEATDPWSPARNLNRNIEDAWMRTVHAREERLASAEGVAEAHAEVDRIQSLAAEGQRRAVRALHQNLSRDRSPKRQ